MRPRVFDELPRTSSAPKGHQESTFDFFNRIEGDGVFWAATRGRLEAWSDHLDDEVYHDFRARIRSGDDYQFNSAYLELYLHEALRRAGYEIVVHPASSTGRRPDFLASRGAERFYLESIAPAPSPAERARSARLARLFDVLERTDDENWWIWFEEVEEGMTSPSAAKLRSAIRRWLTALEPSSYPDVKTRPRFEWSAGDWKVRLSAIPKRKRSDRSGRSIGVFPMTVEFTDDSSPIKQALRRKHSAYGALDAPFVIAVGVFNFDRDRSSIVDALWGSAAIQLSTVDPTDQGRFVREPNGYFGQADAWKHQNVSGVLIVNQLQPTHFASADVSLWLHPHPEHPLPEELGLPFDVAALVDDRVTITESPLNPSDFFDLPEQWPPGVAFR